MREGLAAVEGALLEADVNLDVVRGFMKRVTEQAVGEKVLSSLDPSQQVVSIVHQELVNLMGPVDHNLHLQGALPIIMMCGLQGSGKTTTTGKLALLLKSRGKKPLLVAADLQRPAAIQQLHVLGEQVGVPVFSLPDEKDPVQVCQAAAAKAKQLGADVVMLDTAGRLHIDDELMAELKRIDRRVSPQQVLLVVDGMTGQDAVNSAKAFNEALELDGVILTKLDGDARGGAALSVKQVTGVPIKFIGVGEKLEDIEEFHPDRMAGRILGMGDVLTLVEQARAKLDQEEMAKAEAKLKAGSFTLADFKKQLMQTKRLGPLNKVLGMIPGMSGFADVLGQVDADAEMRRFVGIIDSMTPEERENPTKIIDQNRRRRIAAGAGVQPQEVGELIKQFDGMARLMKDMSSMNMRDRMMKVRELSSSPMMYGGSMPKAKQGTGKRLTADEKKRMKKQRERDERRRKRDG